MNQIQWKNRGWWLSVEINKKASGKKSHAKALRFLDTAPERYDLLLENGKTMARGIFTPESDLRNLTRFLKWVNRWTDTVVHSCGRRLERREVAQLTRLLLCASKNRSGRCEKSAKRSDYWGCPLKKIGLMNYSLAALKNGATYWFSHFKPQSGSAGRYCLDKDRLVLAMKVPELCPLFPQQTIAVLNQLPAEVNLNDPSQRRRWVLTKYRFRTRWTCRFPPLVPSSESTYRRWMTNLIDSSGYRNE